MEEYTKFFTEFEKKFKDFDHKKKFNLLIKTGLGRRETLHSNLITDFLNLNPNYLELFLKEIKVSGFYAKDKIKIYRELPIKGFIDIYIVNKHQNKAIIIENKVDDHGKSGQLKKYYDELVKKYPKGVTAFYLTKYGNLPPNDADCEFNDCLSYEKNIVGWLEECIKITSDHRIKESLEIYVELVRNVINRDKYMEKVFEYLKDNANKMSLAIDIYKTLNGRNFFQDEDFLKDIKKQFEKSLEEIGYENEGWHVVPNGYELELLDVAENPIGYFYLVPSEIYAEFPDESPVPYSVIAGNNLSNDTLKALLTNNVEEVYSYLRKCVSEMESHNNEIAL